MWDCLSSEIPKFLNFPRALGIAITGPACPKPKGFMVLGLTLEVPAVGTQRRSRKRRRDQHVGVA